MLLALFLQDGREGGGQVVCARCATEGLPGACRVQSLSVSGPGCLAGCKRVPYSMKVVFYDFSEENLDIAIRMVKVLRDRSSAQGDNFLVLGIK